MGELILSICMPVYNGGERMYANVKGILESGDQRFELVVCDNGSTDGGIERLQEIQDERLQVFVNEQNIGSMENSLQALSRGNGKYLMLLLDRDILQTEYLSAYIDMLEKQQSGVILNLYVHTGLGENRKINRTSEAAYWLTETPHPSYYVFLGKAFHEITITEWMKKDGNYPASCGLLILKKYEVLLQREYPIIRETEAEFLYIHHSRSHAYALEKKIDIVNSGGGYDEESSYNRFKNYMLFVKEQWKPVDRNIVFGIYQSDLKSILPGYFNMVRSPMHCHRYNISDKRYKSWEYKKLPFHFYRWAKKIIKELRMWSLLLQWRMWQETWRCRRKFCREICN